MHRFIAGGGITDLILADPALKNDHELMLEIQAGKKHGIEIEDAFLDDGWNTKPRPYKPSSPLIFPDGKPVEVYASGEKLSGVAKQGISMPELKNFHQAKDASS